MEEETGEQMRERIRARDARAIESMVWMGIQQREKITKRVETARKEMGL